MGKFEVDGIFQGDKHVVFEAAAQVVTFPFATSGGLDWA